jgi:hypothetical protein
MTFLKQNGWMILAIFFLAVPADVAGVDLIPGSSPQEAAQHKQTVGGGTDQAAKWEFDDRRAQEKYRLYECLILSVVLVLSLAIILKFITKAHHTSDNIVTVSGLVLIVFGTIFIVIMAKAESQLTASMGILGAIAGYLFGTMKKGEGGEKGKAGDTGKSETPIP